MAVGRLILGNISKSHCNMIRSGWSSLFWCGLRVLECFVITKQLLLSVDIQMLSVLALQYIKPISPFPFLLPSTWNCLGRPCVSERSNLNLEIEGVSG